jgi:hypothetical protein
MTETAQTDARAQDLPEEDRERSGENCNPLQLGRCRPRRQFSLKRRRKQVSRLLGRVERAFRAGDREKARRLTRLYLRSDHAIVVAAIEANRKLPPAQRWDERYVELLATCLDPWQGTDERVLVSTKAKENSGYRVICQFGPENRALQTLANKVLEVQTELHPAQFLYQGGRPAASRAVTQTFEEDYTHVVQTDITNCYSSFQGEQVKRLLPLPTQVIQKVVLAKDLNLVAFRIHVGAGRTSALLARCRRGLPHGSISSPPAAEILLSPTPSEFSEGCKPILYVDDLLVFTHSRTEADAVYRTMGFALQRNPAGTFEPGYVQVRRCCDGFNFLGYRFRKQRNSPTVRPSNRSLEKFTQKYRSQLHSAVLEYLRTGRSGKLQRLGRYIRSWHASQDQWDERTLHESSVRDELQQWYILCRQIRFDLGHKLIARTMG